MCDREFLCKTADSLGLKTFAHIGDINFDPDVITLPIAQFMGLNNFEYIVTLADAVMTVEDHLAFEKQARQRYGVPQNEAAACMWLLEKIRFVSLHKPTELNKLVLELGTSKATFSTTIHLLGTQSVSFPSSEKSESDLRHTHRYVENFKILMKYALRMHKNGVILRIGTDTKNGGKAVLSEMILLCENGFTIRDAFKIATYNGALSMGIEDQTGSIEKGKHANMIIWNANPLNNTTAITGTKIVIKDGAIVQPANF